MAKKKKSKFKVDKHALTPKHVKVSDREKKQILETFSATLKDLPKVYKTDPSIINLDVKPGDVVKIIRESQTAGETIFYRVVVDV
ncbi:MAG TPA: DNA-directed RNA polymerase subunit H [Candidatus Nanoarchaeia archaeon]|nr:DNA-directed RNA polymerase subunit H [Candidatus Nanoarchaeia archaeon]